MLVGTEANHKDLTSTVLTETSLSPAVKSTIQNLTVHSFGTCVQLVAEAGFKLTSKSPPVTTTVEPVLLEEVVPVEVEPVDALVPSPLNKSPNRSSKLTSVSSPLAESSVVEVTALSAETNTNDLFAEVLVETLAPSANILASTAACV